jgi:hypothetical protein
MSDDNVQAVTEPWGEEKFISLKAPGFAGSPSD